MTGGDRTMTAYTIAIGVWLAVMLADGVRRMIG